MDEVSVLPISEHLDGEYGVTNKIIMAMHEVASQFVYIGFLLHEVQEYEYFLEKGYSSVYEYASAELGFKKSSVCNFINVCKEFCIIGSGYGALSMHIKDDYKKFKYSHLVEMLSMNDKQRSLCSPDMTVKELRDIKKTSSDDVVQTSGRGSLAGSISYNHMLALEHYLFTRFSGKSDLFCSPEEFGTFVKNTGCDFSFKKHGEGNYPVKLMCYPYGIEVNFNGNISIIPYTVAYWVYVALSKIEKNKY